MLSDCNIFNEDLGEELTVTVLYLVPFPAFLLEYNNLVILEVTQYLRIHTGAFYNRCTNLYLTVVVCQQDFVEAHRGTFIPLKTVYIELTTFLSLKLFACNFYYYVHKCIKRFLQIRGQR